MKTCKIQNSKFFGGGREGSKINFFLLQNDTVLKRFEYPPQDCIYSLKTMIQK